MMSQFNNIKGIQTCRVYLIISETVENTNKMSMRIMIVR